MQTQSNEDQLPLDSTQAFTTPVGIGNNSEEEHTVVNAQDQDPSFNGDVDVLDEDSLQNDDEDGKDEEDLEEADFEVDEEDVEDLENDQDGEETASVYTP